MLPCQVTGVVSCGTVDVDEDVSHSTFAARSPLATLLELNIITVLYILKRVAVGYSKYCILRLTLT